MKLLRLGPLSLPERGRYAFLASLALAALGAALLLKGLRAGSGGLEAAGAGLLVLGSITAGGLPLFSKYLGGPKVNLDLVYALLHMRSVASGKAPPTKILDAVSRDALYSQYSRTLRRAYLLAREWGYNVSEALSYVAKTVSEKTFREVLQRMAATIRLGGDIETFLDVEYNTLFHEYEHLYQRNMDNLRLTLGVYVATMAAFVFTVASLTLLSFFLGSVAHTLITAITASIFVPTAEGALIILLLPREYFDYSGPEARRNPAIRLIDILGAIGVTTGIAIALLYLHARGVNALTLSKSLILAGLPMLPAGLVALRTEGFIQDVDTFFPVFIRSLGGFLSTIPNLRYAVSQILRAELGKLSRLVERLRARLENDIPPDISWKLFAIESGSELVRRGVRIFQDTIDLGGDPQLAGALISEHNNTLLRLRRVRAQIASSFVSSATVIHATVVAISIFVLELIDYFNGIVAQLSRGLTVGVSHFFFLTPVNTIFLSKVLYFFIAVLTVINAYIISMVRPFIARSLWFYMGILLIITGASAYASILSVKYLLHAALAGTTGLPGLPP